LWSRKLDLTPHHEKSRTGHVEGSTLSETAEIPPCIISIRRAGDVGALATLDSFTPTVGMKNDREGWCLYTWIDQNLIREPLRTSACKEGVVIAVGK
jgi:hypothetical protein